jgi:phage terminase large subunit GpA-like protein
MYHLKCPNCGEEFDFDYNEFNSFSKLGLVFRYGPYSFSVKCPNCRKRSRYHVTEADRVD